MIKKEWGTKRTCPKCATRFYDLGNDAPIVCIECGESWKHEPILKARPSVVPRPEKKKVEVPEETETDKDDELDKEVASLLVETEDGDAEEDDSSVIADVSLDDEGDENLADVVDVKLSKDGE